jgi:hypothetical protein
VTGDGWDILAVITCSGGACWPVAIVGDIGGCWLLNGVGLIVPSWKGGGIWLGVEGNIANAADA